MMPSPGRGGGSADDFMSVNVTDDSPALLPSAEVELPQEFDAALFGER